MCARMHLHMYTHTHGCMHTQQHTHAHAHTYACMHLHMHTCTDACNAHTHGCIRTTTHICMHACMRLHTHTHAHTGFTACSWELQGRGGVRKDQTFVSQGLGRIRPSCPGWKAVTRGSLGRFGGCRSIFGSSSWNIEHRVVVWEWAVASPTQFWIYFGWCEPSPCKLTGSGSACLTLF